MNNSEDAPTARESKCWTCKFGMCLSETQQQTVVHQGMVSMEEEESIEDVFDMGMSPQFEEEQEIGGGNIHRLESTRSGAICYWGASEIDSRQPPIRVEFVTECSRFEQKKVDLNPKR